MTRSAVRSIAIVIEDAKWKTLPAAARARLKKAALRALDREKAKGHFTLLLAGDARVKALNGLFRGKNKPTNVLSFPAEENADRYLGDVAIAYGVVRREAKESGKAFADHLVHLAVHGALHLLGHDHMKPQEAARMEGLEREILAEFGIADPYAPIPAKSRRKPAKRHV
ncbi:MAG: rRNA maturation RNase YbeY [Proteobacteria bacterium]|nr:rRNA maturation RNase YbeY [Pseudomonadota bacterium]